MISNCMTIHLRIFDFIERVVYRMEYISVKAAAQKYGVTPRWIQKLCTEGKIDGAVKLEGSGVWMIPKNTRIIFERKNKKEMEREI